MSLQSVQGHSDRSSLLNSNPLALRISIFVCAAKIKSLILHYLFSQNDVFGGLSEKLPTFRSLISLQMGAFC